VTATLDPTPEVTAPTSARRPGWATLDTTKIVFLAWIATFVIGAVVVSMDGGNLLSDANLVKMLTGMSLLGFVAIGQTLAILCRSLDLSVGYVVAWSSLVAATQMRGDDARLPQAVALALGMALLVGLANGVIITKLRVNPFIATLGTGLMIKGYLDTRYQGPAGSVTDSFQEFGYTRMGIVPVSTIVMVVVAVLATLVLRKTGLGYRMFAVGGNDEVARHSGIRTHRTLIAAHVLCSLAAGVAGLLIAARYGTGDARVYDDGIDLDSIAAVVLGGTLLMGGRGSVAGTVAGVGILAVLDTTFDALQVDPFFKDVLRGTVIIVAVALYARRQIDRRSARQRFTRTGEAR
jgi:ribose transport system permease protein